MPKIMPQLDNDPAVSGSGPETSEICKEASVLLDNLSTVAISGVPGDLLQDLNRSIESLHQRGDPGFTLEEKKILQGLAAALREPHDANVVRQQQKVLQDSVTLLSQSLAEKLPADATNKQVGERIGFRRRLEVLQAANEVARTAEQALRVERMLPLMQELRTRLEQTLAGDRLVLGNVEEQLRQLRAPNLATIDNMRKLDRNDITYPKAAPDPDTRIGPAEFYDKSLISPDGHIRIGTAKNLVSSNKINCSIATWVAVMAPRLPDLEKEFGRSAILDAQQHWFIAGPYSEDPPTSQVPQQKGPVAVIEKLNLGVEIKDLQDIRKGDVLVEKYFENGEWNGHEAIVEDVNLDPHTGKIANMTTISANRRKHDPDNVRAIRTEPLNHLQDYLAGKNGYHLFAARLFNNPAGMSVPKSKLLERDRQLQALDKMKKMEDTFAAGRVTPEEAVRNLVLLLELASHPVVTQEDIDRIWIEAGGEGEPPRLS